MTNEGKLVRLQFDKFEREADNGKTKGAGFLQTNPILQKMFSSNLLNGKSDKKFGFKDLFK